MEPKRIADNFEGPSWPNRIFFYFCLFSSILIILMIILCFFAVLNIDLTPFDTSQYAADELHKIGFYDNERYLLSALVQSLAATIALVITLSLVAVQLAAQSYSSRVIEVYKKNPDMWILLCIYIFTIFYGLGLTKIIGLGILGNYMEGAIFVAYFMGFFAFVCLVPYMLKTLDLLKPSTVIKLLAEEITKENMFESLKDDGEIAEKDPIQPIIDIINNSLERKDYETVRNGLKAIRKSTNVMIEKSKFDKSEDDKIVSNILQSIETFGTLAINNKNGNSATSVIFNLWKIGIKAAEKEHDWTAMTIETKICSLGMEAYDNELYTTCGIAIEQLEEIALEAIKAKEKLRMTLTKAKESIQYFTNLADDIDDEELARISFEALIRIEESYNKN
jgi:hypothetical protein